MNQCGPNVSNTWFKGGILKTARIPLCRISMLSKFLFLVLILPYFMMPKFVDQAMGSEAPIWTFDFREAFYEVEFIEKDKAVMIGARGRVFLTHPKYKNLWNPRQSPTKDLLTCMAFVDAKNGWAAGHAGVIIHTTDGGLTWELQKQTLINEHPWLDIQFPSKEVGYVCGAFDAFLKTTDGGKTWQETPKRPGLDDMNNCMAFIDENTGYMAGEFAKVLLTRDGANTWEELDVGDYEGSFFGITLITEEIILVYGVGGKVMRSEDSGQTWITLPTGTDQQLFRGAVNGDDVVIVGATGTLLISHDQGKTFTKKIDKNFMSFAGVGAHPEGGFICVGIFGTIVRLEFPVD